MMRLETGRFIPATEAQQRDYSSRVIVGEEILVHRRTVRALNHSLPNNCTHLLDQVHDYYLGIATGSKVEITKIGIKPTYINFETNEHASRKSDRLGSTTALLPGNLRIANRIDNIWFGKEIEDWAKPSALYQVILRELREKLGIPYFGELERLTLGEIKVDQLKNIDNR